MKINFKEISKKIINKIKNFNIQDCRVSFNDGMKNLEANGRSLFIAIILAVVLMLVTCLAVFFIAVKGPEKVLVPEVKNKELTQALLEMQVKELYPKIQLRYDEKPFGTVLNQSPSSGAIVKAGTRVTLTVSRGAVVSEVGNYVGLKYDEVKIDLSAMFTGATRPLIVLAEPSYKADVSEAGTILEQIPAQGTKISEPVTVHLIVSRGPNFENTRVPSYIGKSVQDMLALLPDSKLVIDFMGHRALAGEKENSVIDQQKFETEYVPNFSRVSVEMAFPENSDDGKIYGIFEAKVAKFPYPVSMTVECVEKTGQRFPLVTLQHTGGDFTIPYAVAEDSELILRIAGREVKRISVSK
ncbi:PASTA domain-containing protein [Treponema pectinovorum]|uniref:PASTA domain-containing protein n=1 Tax=Treponema pectinovorum TaxID=164 RepID=UPI003D8E40C9